MNCFKSDTGTGHQTPIFQPTLPKIKWNTREIPFCSKGLHQKTHTQQDLEDNIQLSLFSLRMLPGIHSKKGPFFLLLGRDLTLLCKFLSLKTRYIGDEKVSLNWKQSGMPLHLQGEIYVLGDKSLTFLKTIK